MAENPTTTDYPIRSVLKDLNRIALSGEPLQARVDKMTALIAQKLDVPVCSCYIVRPGDVLELFSTKGLDVAAVHETFLRVGEGLIGEIALQRKPLIFTNAWEHPSFVHKPETNEEGFKSLMGVPIMDKETLLGVLAVQKDTVFQYPPEMVEVLQTAAMLLSNMMVAAEQKSLEKKILSGQQHKKIEGVRLIAGLAVGKAFIHQRMDSIGPLLATDSKRELKKLTDALKSVEAEVNTMLANPFVSDEEAGIFETYLMFTQDKGWISKITKAIESGLTAKAAVRKVGEEIAGRMDMITDPYIKERIHDFKDLANRLIRHLTGNSKQKKQLPKNAILVAQSMGPAELLDYDVSRVRAIILEQGSQAMHVVIVARSLNLPVIVVKDIVELVSPDDMLAVNATESFIYLNPSDEVLDDFEEQLKVVRRQQNKYAQMKGLPSVTKDGVAISLNVNGGLSADMLNSKGFGFDGIGLYRTELPFMASESLPDVAAQTEIYNRAFAEAQGKPIVFRTLDIGSDKVLPYFENTEEKNPAMGWRSIRITLDRRSILRGQLRAFIRAAAGRELRIMFPMISDIGEFLEAKKTLDIELKREVAHGGQLPSKIEVGTMLEVPSLLFQLPDLVKLADFVSIGTNDLSQFLFATDRGNPMIWNRYDALSPSFLKTLQYVNAVCREAGIPCSVCGEMASRPLEALALIGLGFTKLSMNPSSLGAIKAVVRTTDQKQLSDFISTVLSNAVVSIRPLLKSYAVDHGIFI